MLNIKKRHQTWLELFLHNCHTSNRSSHTIKSYRSDLLKYVGWFEQTYPHKEIHEANTSTISTYLEYLGKQNKDLAPVRSSAVEDFEKRSSKIPSFFKKTYRMVAQFFKKTSDRLPIPAFFRGKELKVSSKRRHLSSINNFYEYLRQRNADDKEVIFKNNPVKLKIHSISVKEKDVDNTKLLTTDHWEKIGNKIYRIQDRFMIHLLYFGGLRLSELTFLKVKDFNPETKTLNFVRKGGDVHRLKIQNFDQIYALLNDYLDSKKVASEYVFTNKLGRVYSTKTLYNHIKKIFYKAGIIDEDLGPHSFRKACATNLYIKSKDLLLVRDYLNHSDAKVTQTYIEY